MINYDVFWETIKERKITTYSLINDYGFSKGLIDNLKHNRAITTTTLDDICNKLEIEPENVISYKRDKNAKEYNVGSLGEK